MTHRLNYTHCAIPQRSEHYSRITMESKKVKKDIFIYWNCIYVTLSLLSAKSWSEIFRIKWQPVSS